MFRAKCTYCLALTDFFLNDFKDHWACEISLAQLILPMRQIGSLHPAVCERRAGSRDVNVECVKTGSVAGVLLRHCLLRERVPADRSGEGLLSFGHPVLRVTDRHIEQDGIVLQELLSVRTYVRTHFLLDAPGTRHTPR